jgi:hypothetical protein
MAILLIAPTVAAFETTITVTTHPSTWAMVRVFEAGNHLNLLQSFLDTQVGESGTISFDLSSNRTPVDIEVYIKLEKNGQSFVYKKFEDVSASEPIALTVMKGDTETESETTATTQSENATVATTTETVTEDTENTTTTAITGNAIAGEGSSFKSYYIIVAVLVAGLIIGGLLFARKQMRSNGTLGMNSTKEVSEQKTAPVSETSSEQLSSETLDSLKAELQKTKERLQVTTSDLAKMRNQDRITKLEQNIKEEEAELRKLRDESQQS